MASGQTTVDNYKVDGTPPSKRPKVSSAANNGSTQQATTLQPPGRALTYKQ